jgi:hypothetical protein
MTENIKEKVKAKITMMVIILGLIVGANIYFPGTYFLYLFDTLCFAGMIVILFGIKKDTGRTATPKETRKIYATLLGLVIGITLVLAQFIPRPYVYGTDLMGIILAYQIYRGYKQEDQKVKSSS